jgi:hypothetical protein
LALENVLDAGRHLHESIKDIRPEDRSQLSFDVSKFANSYGFQFPKWLGDAVKSFTGQDIREPNLALVLIAASYAGFSADVYQLDDEAVADFLLIGTPSSQYE